MDIIIRCSALDDIMTNDRSGKGMGETAKKKFVELYIQQVYGRQKTVKSKYLEKGTEREQDAITLLTQCNLKMYRKNTERLTNEFITGEWDIDTDDEIIDIKNSWDLFTFREANEKDYKWQRIGYTWLKNVSRGSTAFCLINGTAKHIMDEKRKASYDFGLDPEADPKYIERCQQIERNHIFDMAAFVKENPGFDFHSDLSEWKWDIPHKDRVKMFTLTKDESDIEAIKARIIEGRKYLKKEFGLAVSTPRTEAA